MLTCKQFLQELNDYFDPNADRELKQKLNSHVSECPNCFVLVDTTEKTLKVYKGVEPQTIPDDVKTRLLKALERKMAAKAARKQAES